MRHSCLCTNRSTSRSSAPASAGSSSTPSAVPATTPWRCAVAGSGRLARRLVLAFLFVGLVPLGLLAAFGPRIVRRHFTELSRDRIASTLAGVRHELELRRDTVRGQVATLAADPDLVRQLALVSPDGTPVLSLIDHVVERRTAIGLDW